MIPYTQTNRDRLTFTVPVTFVQPFFMLPLDSVCVHCRKRALMALQNTGQFPQLTTKPTKKTGKGGKKGGGRRGC